MQVSYHRKTCMKVSKIDRITNISHTIPFQVAFTNSTYGTAMQIIIIILSPCNVSYMTLKKSQHSLCIKQTCMESEWQIGGTVSTNMLSFLCGLVWLNAEMILKISFHSTHVDNSCTCVRNTLWCFNMQKDGRKSSVFVIVLCGTST